MGNGGRAPTWHAKRADAHIWHAERVDARIARYRFLCLVCVCSPQTPATFGAVHRRQIHHGSIAISRHL